MPTFSNSSRVFVWCYFVWPPETNSKGDISTPEKYDGTIIKKSAIASQVAGDGSGSLISGFHSVRIAPVQSSVLTPGSPAVGIKKRE